MPGRRALTFLVALLALGAAAAAVAGPVYIWTDADGVEHWSDRPPGVHEAVEGEAETVSPELRNRGVSRMNAEPLPAAAEEPSAGSGAPETDAGGSADPAEPATGEEEAGASGTPDDGEEAPKSRAERLAEVRERRAQALRNRVQGRPVERAGEQSPAPAPPSESASEPESHGYGGYAAGYQL